MIVSGLDDLLLDLLYLVSGVAKPRPVSETPVPPPADALGGEESLIALWVPAWREAEVIAQMVAHNVASIRYRRYHIFCGTYPNDDATLSVFREIETRYPNLHISLTPHDGPTSKADNMNWIYQNLCLVEERIGEKFDIVVIHDSEDLIHPDEFRWLNYYCRDYDFVQVPVLGLPTPWWELTHGIYCDEFAETQQKDLPTRNRMGGFSPSCGVGTGYRRDALAQLAESESNRLFEPDSLTEDYLNGLRMHRLGMRQIYLPVAFVNGQPVATREYFPRKFKASVRQRSRWVTGIALQTWEKIGWSSDWWENYWFWRDRKGLVGNPLSLLANVLLVLGIAGLVPKLPPHLSWVVMVGLTLQLVRAGWRMYFCGRVYGVAYALLVPVRIPWSNLVNTLATLSAILRFAKARMRNEPLVWLKTEHAYPNRAALTGYARRIGEVLVDHEWVTVEMVERAVAEKPEGVRVGEQLVEMSAITWEQLYEGLSIVSGFEFTSIRVEQLDLGVARSLPRGLMDEARLQPVCFEADGMLLATSEIPGESLLGELRKFTSIEPRVVLVTPENLAELRESTEAPAIAFAA